MSDDDILRRLERIESGIAVLAELIHGIAPVAPQVPAGMIGPGRTPFRGGFLDLAEPLAADWLPGMTLETFISQGKVLADPSNGLPGAPLRSPSGYPLVYGLGYNNAGQQIAIGAPRISFNGQTFEAEAEIEQHKEWLRTRPPAGDFSPRTR